MDYAWWVYLHIVGAFAFVFGHGASGLAAFRIRATRDPAQIRTLLDLAPPMAQVIRDGEPTEIPTAEVVVGELLFIRPGSKVPVDAEVIEGESELDESQFL